MSRTNTSPLVAVDIGNSRIKFGLFESLGPGGTLPTPSRTLDIVPHIESLDRIGEWLSADEVRTTAWTIGSVNRRVASRLIDWLRDRGAEHVSLLAATDLPLVVDLPRPDMVGIDRLLGAVAANQLRDASTPAVVVDLGTAITVDVVSAAGAFLGGAIMPGIELSGRALHEFTDLLPLLDMPHLADPPPPLGKNTVDAMKAGIYWEAVGGVRYLIELQAKQLGQSPQVFLTGGAAPVVAPLLATRSQFEPNLVLAGIALTAWR